MLHLHIGSRRLVASWSMTALTVLGVLLFAQLGRWQWHRAAQKRAVAAAFAAGTALDTGALGERSTSALPRYAHVRVSGEYDGAHQFLLDNMNYGGRTGYEVLTPLRLQDGRVLLVNRGWIELPGGRRDRVPDIAIGATGGAAAGGAAAGRVDISGRLDALPVTGLALGVVPPSLDPVWPKRTSFPAMSQLEAALGHRLEARQLLLAPGAPDGYIRDWHSAGSGFGPERHMSYAIQWWGLGALCLFLFGFMNLERRP